MDYARKLNSAEIHGEDIYYTSAFSEMLNDPNMTYEDRYMVLNYRDYLVDNFLTTLSYPGGSLNKTETMTYINGQDAGFEIIQSFAITTGKVTDDMVQYWLNQNSTYLIGHVKASYGTFMTALTTLWLNDKLANEMDSCLNVTWIRTTPTVVMSGLNINGAYVSCINPAMGMNVIGDVGNVVSFRFMCSLMLSDLEQAALGNAGLNGTSTASQIFLGIMHGEHFQIIFDEAAGTATIILNDNPNMKIVIDMVTGLVKDIVDDGSFQYKGSLASGDAYCYHEQRTDRLTRGLSNFFNSPGGHTVASIGGSMLIALGLVALGPVGWVAGAAIIGVGVAGIWFGSGMADDPTDPRNQIDFVATVGLSFVGGPEAVSLKTVLKTTYQSELRYCVGQRGYRVLAEEAWLGTGGIDSATQYVVSQGGGCVDSYVIHEL